MSEIEIWRNGSIEQMAIAANVDGGCTRAFDRSNEMYELVASGRSSRARSK